jgi:hypothetical protein
MWIIASKTERDDETGERLTWSNENGWTLGETTIFTDEEQSDGDLPMGGYWVKL